MSRLAVLTSPRISVDDLEPVCLRRRVECFPTTAGITGGASVAPVSPQPQCSQRCPVQRYIFEDCRSKNRRPWVSREQGWGTACIYIITRYNIILQWTERCDFSNCVSSDDIHRYRVQADDTLLHIFANFPSAFTFRITTDVRLYEIIR